MRGDYWNPVCVAMFDGNTEALIDFCRNMFSLEIDDGTANRLCVLWKKFNPTMKWEASAGPAMWIKSRLKEMPRVIPGCVGETLPEAQTAILHCFFLSLQETHEMLARLHKYEPKTESSVARSKVSSTLEVIHPIDATAAKVVDKAG